MDMLFFHKQSSTLMTLYQLYCILMALYKFLYDQLQEALYTVTHALVTSYMDYCYALYMELPLKNIWKLQLVQNAAAWATMGIFWFADVIPLLHILHWLSVGFWVLVTYQVLQTWMEWARLFERLPLSICLYPPHQERHTVKSCQIKECHLTGLRKHAFSIMRSAL